MELQRQKKFMIGEKSFIATFPNVGQIIDIESLKQALTNNRYGQMVVSGIASMYYALDLVDAIAFYQIVVPEVARYYDIKNYAELPLDKAKDLIDAYQTEIRPWYTQTMNELKGVAVESGTDTEAND